MPTVEERLSILENKAGQFETALTNINSRLTTAENQVRTIIETAHSQSDAAANAINSYKTLMGTTKDLKYRIVQIIKRSR